MSLLLQRRRRRGKGGSSSSSSSSVGVAVAVAIAVVAAASSSTCPGRESLPDSRGRGDGAQRDEKLVHERDSVFFFVF